MSVGSQELDRSILEKKERDELVAIAEALGQKPTTRVRKADIVDLILRLTGVQADDGASETAAPKPRRSRSRKAAEPEPKAATSSAATEDPGADGSADTKGETGAKGGAEEKSGADAKSGAEEKGGAGASSSDDVAAEDTATHDEAASRETGKGDAGGKDDAGAKSEAGRRDGTGEVDHRSEGADADRAAKAAKDSAGKDSAGNHSARTADGGADARERGDTGRDTAPSDAASQGDEKGQRGQGASDTGQASSRNGSDRNGSAQDHVGQSTDGKASQGQGRQNQDGQNQGGQSQGGQGQNQGGQSQNRQNQGNQNQGGQRNQGRNGQNQNRQNQQNLAGEGEPGNRRRRRRGRDRDRGNQPEEVFQGEPIEVAGLLDLRDEGYGFLRLRGYLPSKDDVYVSVKQVRQFGLRKGDHLTGGSRPATRNEKNPALLRIDKVNGEDPEKARKRPRFEDLTPLFPDEKLRLETAGDATNMTARIVDLLSPIGKGQRGLIVSPPKAGKTTVMKTIARSIETNNPEAHLIVLLVDERPEEVTDFRRWLKRGEVAASTFDRPSDEHTHVAELVIERAKRMVEDGRDVVIILDGITRLARAYNLAAPASGRIMSGGIDAGALYPPKKFFGAARNVEEGGSLTILATALVETNSRMDDHIFEEFKGTGNMELKLDRRLADRRIYPAIDVDASGTRHEELLFERRQLQQVWKLRRVLSGLSSEGGSGAPGLELLVDRMKTFKSNDEFLAEIAKAPSIS